MEQKNPLAMASPSPNPEDQIQASISNIEAYIARLRSDLAEKHQLIESQQWAVCELKEHSDELDTKCSNLAWNLVQYKNEIETLKRENMLLSNKIRKLENEKEEVRQKVFLVAIN